MASREEERYYIGRGLRAALEGRGVGVAEIAEASDCDPSYIYRLLNDTQSPAVGPLRRIEAALGLAPGDLYRTAYPAEDRLPQIVRGPGRPRKSPRPV